MKRKLLKNPQAVCGMFIILVAIIIAIGTPIIAPNNPELVDVTLKYSDPSRQYPLGTDALGRCVLSRLLYGTRYSLGMSVPVLGIVSVIGLFLGTLSVCAGKVVNSFLDWLCDTFIALPQLVVGIAIISMLGEGYQDIVIAIVVGMWAWFTKVVRAFAQVEMGKDYITAARIAGCKTIKIVLNHIIPNILPQFLVYISTGISTSILMVSTFAFLGIGLPAGTPEWGAMLKEASTCLYNHKQMLIYPGLCIFITAAGFNLFGEALRDELMAGEERL